MSANFVDSIIAPEIEQSASIDAALGARIRHIREKQGMSQTVLGNHIGVSFQQVQKYERGSNRITASALLAICTAFAITPSKLLEDIEERHSHTRYTGLVFDEQMTTLADCFARIPSPTVRAYLVGLIESLGKADAD